MRRTLLALFVICLTSAAALAQTNIAIVNPGRVFAEMQETKDLKAKLEIDRKNLEGEVQQRQQKVKDLQAARDLLKQDSPQYQQADQAFMKEAIEFDTWSKITQATLQGQQKQQMKALFDKIVAAAQQVAQQKGIDLVIADQRAEDINTQQLNVEQLRTLLNQRNILYSSEKVDLNSAVIAVLDTNYKASGGAPPAAATPAPAPAPAPAK